MKLRFAIAALAAFSIGGLLVTTAMPAHAQAGKRAKRAGAGARREDPMMAAFKAVGPTADAQTKFDALFATYQADRKNLTTTVTDAKARRTQQMDLEKKFRTDADALLTPDQVTKFHQGIVAIPIMRNLDRELMLTPEEKTKIEPLLNDYAQKTDGMKAKEKKTALDELKPKVRETLATDQQTKFDLMPNLTGGGGRRNPAPTTITPPTTTIPPTTTTPPTNPAAP